MEPWFAQLIVLFSLFTPFIITRSGPILWLPAFIVNMLGVYASILMQATGVAELWRAMTYVEILYLILNTSLAIARALELAQERDRERYERIIQPP